MRIVIIIFFSILSFNVVGQSFKQYLKAGDKSLAEKDYYSAMMYYQNALEIKEGNIKLHYKAGVAAREFFAYTIAESHFDKVEKSSQKEEFPLLDFYAADVKQTLGKYEEARAMVIESMRFNDRSSVVSMNSYRYALIEEALGNYEIAYENAKRALRRAKQIGFEPEIKDFSALVERLKDKVDGADHPRQTE